ncbi:iron-containing alcohol dehydrogenase [Acutalibacter muris]|jgi:alcohol dehydrogenase class IV|uniref:iron-containing alcohol dehydrogenase n=1 Tax=Acutalibacter muris TaxID=1796620 RepID=UPI0026F38B7A|nr:iron-containing alcohol dehydrogenase [Acutalibacter muris]
MAVNRFVLNGISYHGKGAINEIPGIIEAKGFKKAFIATDPDLLKFGVTKKVTDLMDKADMAYEVYSDIKPNPTIENVQSGVKAYKESGADYMIAVGGGSSMDTGKAIGIIINNPEFADVRSLEGVDTQGMDQGAYRKAAIDAVRRLSVDVGIPTKLEALKEEDLQFLSESAAADACAPGNPKEAGVEDFVELFRKLM